MKSEESITYYPDIELPASLGNSGPAAGAEKKAGIVNSYPGILEEGLIYSCAGPRIDPDDA